MIDEEKKTSENEEFDLREQEYLWTSGKDAWVLVKHPEGPGYSIVNRYRQELLQVNTETLHNLLVERMLKEGNEVFDTVYGAFESVKKENEKKLIN